MSISVFQSAREAGGPGRWLAGAALCLSLIAIAGCSGEKEPAPAQSDPAVSGALGDDIVVDPDLAGGQGSALAADEGEITLPPQDRSTEAMADAMQKAMSLAGLPEPLPEPKAKGQVAALTTNAATAAQVAQASRLAKTDCTTRLEYSNTWAAKLPAALPVYPRGAVQEAAGVAGDDCAMTVVNYATPVEPEDVLVFYRGMAGKNGYSARYARDGEEHVLGGSKGKAAYVVYAHTLKNGITEVNLVTAGR